jgi:hypothetical protein
MLSDSCDESIRSSLTSGTVAIASEKKSRQPAESSRKKNGDDARAPSPFGFASASSIME